MPHLVAKRAVTLVTFAATMDYAVRPHNVRLTATVQAIKPATQVHVWKMLVGVQTPQIARVLGSAQMACALHRVPKQAVYQARCAVTTDYVPYRVSAPVPRIVKATKIVRTAVASRM